MDADAWQNIQDQIEYARRVAGIRKGLNQARDAQGIEAAAFFATLDARDKA